MNKNRCKKIISHLLVGIWMVVIFCFSMQTGEDSSSLSGGVCHFIANMINTLFRLDLNEMQFVVLVDGIHFFVRKAAHMTEFGILAMLFFYALGSYGKFQSKTMEKFLRKRYWTAWILTVCYACTDEIHQFFVPDRACTLFDVGVDSTGALLALFVVFLLRKLFISWKGALHKAE